MRVELSSASELSFAQAEHLVFDKRIVSVGVAQLVARHVANVQVAGSKPVTHSSGGKLRYAIDRPLA